MVAGPTVLHVMTRYGTGGSERRLRDAIAATPYLGHTVVVGAEHDRILLHSHLPLTPVEVLPSLVRQPDPRVEPKAYRWLSRRLRRGDVQLIHTHQSKAGLHGRLAAWRRGLPSVHSLSMANFGDGFGRAADASFRSAERFLGRHTTRFAVVGTDLRDRYLSLGIPLERFSVIRSSIDLDAFRTSPAMGAAAAALGIDRTHGVFAYVGRFEYLKGVEDLPNLVAQVRAHRGHAPTLVLAGDGPLRQSVVERCVRVSDGAQVIDMGHTDRVPEVMAAADALVLLSKSEGVPQVLVQALAAGCPFVSYAADGARELAALPGAQVCRVVPSGDLKGAASEVADLLAHPVRPVVDLNEWSCEAVFAHYRELYQLVLSVEKPAKGVLL